MEYTLMHKELPIAQLELDEETGSIRKVLSVQEASHMPLGVMTPKGMVDRGALNDWWIDRSIPASRSGVRKAMEILAVQDTRLLLTKCFGLSLSDQYWIRPAHQTIEWKEINFFDHPFSEDIGDVLLGKAKKTTGFDFHSPDNTSDGCLKKRWKIIDGKRCLLKAGSSPFCQQPFNEIIASSVMKRLNISHVPYTLIWSDDEPYSVCEDFVTQDTELVTAWRIMQTEKKANSTSVYRHYLNCCEALGIPNMEQSMNEMIVVDYLIANEDRHQNNFGAIRNAETLQWLGAAPVFDSGSSLGYDKLAGQILTGKNVVCKPFKKTHEEQLRLVTNFDWISFDRLQGLSEEIEGIFADAGEYRDDVRTNAIVRSVNRRIELLEKMALSAALTVDQTEDDVEMDIAEDYQMKQ
jgi:hypothetical protein